MTSGRQRSVGVASPAFNLRTRCQSALLIWLPDVSPSFVVRLPQLGLFQEVELRSATSSLVSASWLSHFRTRLLCSFVLPVWAQCLAAKLIFSKVYFFLADCNMVFIFSCILTSTRSHLSNFGRDVVSVCPSASPPRGEALRQLLLFAQCL